VSKKTIDVLVRDVKQGKTIWLVNVTIVDGMSDEHRIELMKRYPHLPERWANDDAWGRARIRKPEQIFVHNREAILEELSYLWPAARAFNRRKDAWAYYGLVAPVVAQKFLELEARFPPHINMPKNWIGKDLALTLAEIPMDASMKERK
jgi:hypothetical protein